MRAGRDDAAVELVDEIRHFRRRARGDLLDRREAMLLVARVDALRAVARVEILVELEAGLALEDRHADLFGAARVHRGLVHHDVALLQHLADALARLDERGEVGTLVFVDGGRDRHDVHAALLQVRKICGEGQPVRRPKLGAGRFASAVAAGLELGDALRLHIEADGVEMLAELDRQRQPDISQAYDAQAALTKVKHDCRFPYGYGSGEGAIAIVGPARLPRPRRGWQTVSFARPDRQTAIRLIRHLKQIVPPQWREVPAPARGICPCSPCR